MVKIAINSKTNGNVRHEMLNNRRHLVTMMRPIVGDTVMNRMFYPDEQVTNSFQQLEQLPAPCGHPKVNGQNISAFHPLAVNSHNVGAFIRNPVKKGKEVYNELWVDEGIANQTENGKEILTRLQEGIAIGVSTGLQLEKTAVNEEGLDYDWIGRNYQYDHVALLLNESPAGGDQTVTINQGDDELEVVELTTNEFSFHSVKEQLAALLNEGTSRDEYFYIADVVISDDGANNLIYEVKEQYYKRDFSVVNGVVSLGVMVAKVFRTVTYAELTGGDASTNLNHAETKEAIMPAPATSDESVAAITIENAMELLTSKGFTVVNAKDAQAEDMKYFMDNKPAIQTLIANQETEVVALREKVLAANSELTAEEVDGMSVGLLRKLGTPQVANHSLNAGFVQTPGTVATNSADVPDYSPNYDGGE